MPSVQFVMVATLAAMATTTAAAPTLPNVPIAIETPWPPVVATSTVTATSVGLPWSHPSDIVVRSPGGPTILDPAGIKDPLVIIARAPYPPPFDPWPEVGATSIYTRAPQLDPELSRIEPPSGLNPRPSRSNGVIIARAPDPAPVPDVATDQPTDLLEVTFTVDCGCWNICTLEKVINKDIVCEATCDPQYLCGATPTTTDVKRDAETFDKRLVTTTTTTEYILDKNGKVIYIKVTTTTTK